MLSIMAALCASPSLPFPTIYQVADQVLVESMKTSKLIDADAMLIKSSKSFLGREGAGIVSICAHSY